MPKKQNKIVFVIFSLLKSLVFAVIITLIVGYLLGCRYILVNGWSAQPDIRYQSIIITQKTKFEDLKVGDYITFSMTGSSYITHQIISIDIENDQIICADNQYNSETGEYEHGGQQVLKYENVVGKVVFSNYILGRTIFTIKENPWILVGLFVSAMLLLIVRDKCKTEPEFF